MTNAWETDKLYVRILRVGGVWNWLAALSTFILVPFLPDELNIEPPRYPLFIHFNLMTIVLFGFIHFYVANRLSTMRGMMKILMWSKLLTAGVFAYTATMTDMPGALSEFLAPAMCLDLAFGLVYLRYLFYSRAKLYT